ncbi:MAG: hypothetical protein Ct9H90mP6_04870 [Gammaproteobacteria bacterium]|nr:MAG: hypothetical protein Ct9H90mP6_04870 [Gammaproteobacteria bacterium]
MNLLWRCALRLPKSKYNGWSIYSCLKGKQYNSRASRVLNLERLETEVGPLKIEVIEPLKN